MEAKKLSVVVIFYNMQREARRTLHSLSAAYQKGVDGSEYEVIAIDNGSTSPLDAEEATSHGPNFDYRYFRTDAVSPVDAVNFGVELAQGEHVAVIVDGARMATPGLIWSTLRGLRLFPQPFACALSWHLGPDIQGRSMQVGYCQTVEDKLLESICWPDDGYRLFEISTIAPSSDEGFFGGVPPECSWFAMLRATFQQIGGFEPRFRSAGGGFVNHDFRNRALATHGIEAVVLLGEGVFHQFHGGIATNVKTEDLPSTLAPFHEEYLQIRAHNDMFRSVEPAGYFGKMPEQARRFLVGKDVPDSA